MSSSQVNIHNFPNGLTLVTESMPGVSSAAFCMLLPAGVARDPQNRTGAAAVLSDLVFRGAGEYDNRTLNIRLDNLGIQRNASVASLHTNFSAALISDKLEEALALYAGIVRTPRLEEQNFLACKDLAVQNIDSLEDDPRQKISLLIREKYFPYPFGRPDCGKKEELRDLDIRELQSFWKTAYSPAAAILAVAGNVDFQSIKTLVEKHFADWQGHAPNELTVNPTGRDYFHQSNEGAQVHIALMYPSVSYGHKEFYSALAAVTVLSGGMGSRLFTEVREKRGLCYAVSANHQITGPYASVRAYVGSSPEQAQQAFDVMLHELQILHQGITENELDRAKIGLRASLIMAGESTSARASACARDLYYLGRVRSLEEIDSAIQSLSVRDVLDHVTAFQPERYTVATIGPKPIEVPGFTPVFLP